MGACTDLVGGRSHEGVIEEALGRRWEGFLEEEVFEISRH